MNNEIDNMNELFKKISNFQISTSDMLSNYPTININNYTLLTLRDKNINNNDTNISLFYLFIFYDDNRNYNINYEILENNENLSFIHTSWLHLGIALLSCFEIEFIYKSILNGFSLVSNHQQFMQRLVIINEALVYSLSNITIVNCGDVSDHFILNLLKICVNLNVNISLIWNKNMTNINVNYIYLLESFLLGNSCLSIVVPTHYYAKLFYCGYISKQESNDQIKMVSNLWGFWKRNMKYNYSNITCINAIISTLCDIFLFLNNNLIELLLNYILKEININHISNYNILGLMENLINKLPIKWFINRNNEKITNLVQLILNKFHQPEELSNSINDCVNNNNNRNNNIRIQNVFNNQTIKMLISYIKMSLNDITNYSNIVKSISSLESIQKNYVYFNKSFDVKDYYNDYLNLSLSCSIFCNQLVINNNNNNKSDNKEIKRIILFTSEYACRIIINLSKNSINKLPSEEFQVLVN